MNDQPNVDRLRAELIQVAGVAVAIIEDIDYGVSSVSSATTGRILLQVFRERHSQDDKWGPQSHGANDWMHILMEEVGEAAEEIRGADPKRLRHVITNVGKASKRYLRETFGM